MVYALLKRGLMRDARPCTSRWRWRWNANGSVTRYGASADATVALRPQFYACPQNRRRL